VSHLREQRTGDRGSGELRQIELGRGAGAASWRCGRSAPSGRTRRRARLDKLIEPGADVAPVPQFFRHGWPSSPLPAHAIEYSNARGARRFFLMGSTSYKSAPKLNLTRARVGVKMGVRVSDARS